MTKHSVARAVAVAPHALAAQAAAGILREGGDAIQAMVAAAAVIAVVYPHMTGLGGDAFWLIHEPGHEVRAIDASGPAGGLATPEFFLEQGWRTPPSRGPLAANTVAGTVSGWDLALEISRSWGKPLPLARLLEEAIAYADGGMPVSASQARSTESHYSELAIQPGFRDQYLVAGQTPVPGALLYQPALAETLRRLARAGLRDFYTGAIADSMASELACLGSPITRADFAAYQARSVGPLKMAHRLGTLYNLPPPTQGVLSLMILGILDRAGPPRYAVDSADMIHYAVEATKRAFALRDAHKERFFSPFGDVSAWLAPAALDGQARAIDPLRAGSWRARQGPADTVWLGVIDQAGRAISFIQSLYHEFGSGVVLPQTGICWQNRGASFSLTKGAVDVIAPGRTPYHTLNPALAQLHDGRVLAWGAMGGDGQPQTQAAVFTRAAVYGIDPQQAVAAPRWLLGRTWGNPSDSLKIEARFPEAVIQELERRGHVIERLAPFDEAVGHAGLVVRASDGSLSGGADPRSDGALVCVP
ncbi:MAG: gamma-glutamyltransferase family protein [Acidiferrobacter sp.]